MCGVGGKFHFSPLIKYEFHCCAYQQTHNCPAALYSRRLYQVSPVSVSKCRTHGCKSIRAQRATVLSAAGEWGVGAILKKMTLTRQL